MIDGACHCGAVRWRFNGLPVSATACNCTVCRRYGALWAYGLLGKDIEVSGETATYARGDKDLDFHFCKACGCVAFWRPAAGRRSWDADSDGGVRVGVNLRLAEPEAVGAVPIKHLDGFDRWETVERKGECVADMWF